MPEEFRMPALGADMDYGTVVEWHVAPGDRVKRGDVVAVVETDKGAIDVEIFQEGVVKEIVVPVGRRVPVGEVLALLEGAGPSPQPSPAKAGEGEERPSPRPSPAGAGEGEEQSARRVRPGPSPASAGEGGPKGRVRATPAARALAAELGLDLSAITGTGPGGVILRGDVERAGPSSQPSPAKAGEGAEEPSPQPSPAKAGEGAEPSPQPSPAKAGEGADRPSPAPAGEGGPKGRVRAATATLEAGA